jgi:hypothetical protein
MRSLKFSGREGMEIVPDARWEVKIARIGGASNIFVVLYCTERSSILRVLTFCYSAMAIFCRRTSWRRHVQRYTPGSHVRAEYHVNRSFIPQVE